MKNYFVCKQPIYMNIIVSGASRGIGYQLVLKLAAMGGHRVLALSRNEDALQQLVHEAQQFGTNTITRHLSCDLVQLPEEAIRSAIEEMGGLDVLVHNAGMLKNKPFHELSIEDWKATYQVNVFGVVQLSQLALPFLKESHQAHILNIGSMGGFQGSSKFAGLSAYSSSKAALANLTECMAEEFTSWGIAANCLALGAVKTEMLEAAFPGFSPPMTASNMADFIAYFALHGQQFFNGKILPVSSSTP